MEVFVLAGGATLSAPNGAKGFGLPSVPSGIRVMLESCKLVKAILEKIESSNFIFLTLNSKERKSLAIKESGVPVSLLTLVVGLGVLAEETKLA